MKSEVIDGKGFFFHSSAQATQLPAAGGKALSTRRATTQAPKKAMAAAKPAKTYSPVMTKKHAAIQV